MGLHFIIRFGRCAADMYVGNNNLIFMNLFSPVILWLGFFLCKKLQTGLFSEKRMSKTRQFGGRFL